MSGGGSSSSSSPTKPRHQHLPPPLKTPSLLVPNHGGPTPKPQYTPPLLLTVRFSTSIPDLLLDIPHPSRTTVAALKHLIRTRLEQPNSQRRLRFIHGGKILPDSAVLGAVLKVLPPPPSAAVVRDENDPKGKGKGKAVEGGGHLAQRVYVNCSIGDLLTDAELDEERKRAEEPVPEQQPAAGSGLSSPYPQSQSPLPGGGSAAAAAAGAGQERAPRGFDRLLSAGFTAAEVNQLRLQFRSIQEARHTADTLPSPDTLRGMEDAWIDNNNAGTAPTTMPTGGDEAEAAAVAGGGEEFGVAGVLDILLKGMFIGFVWPLGAIGWLVRDEEKIPKRMRVFVYFGFVLSLLIGTIRAIG
ncbi:hypothetical protein diail_2544 [Diaporthe ilicicola]|nr:hypothetical protein diail_2544 [Diaporthe ilicicola]